MAPSLHPGDCVTCHIKEAHIVSSYSGYDTSEPFQIVAVDSFGYYLYIPDHIVIRKAVRLDERTAKALKIQKQFIGSYIVYIEPSQVAAVKSTLDGCVCSRCKEYYAMAEPNQEDGTMVCYLCRTYKYR